MTLPWHEIVIVTATVAAVSVLFWMMLGHGVVAGLLRLFTLIVGLTVAYVLMGWGIYILPALGWSPDVVLIAKTIGFMLWASLGVALLVALVSLLRE